MTPRTLLRSLLGPLLHALVACACQAHVSEPPARPSGAPRPGVAAPQELPAEPRATAQPEPIGAAPATLQRLPDPLDPAGSAAAGALEIGDPYFPGLGNGGYDVLHYDMVLDLDMASDELAGEVTVRARALQELARFSLDLYGLEVEAVHIDGEAARFERTPPAPGLDANDRPFKSAELVVHPPRPLVAGAEFETEVRYSGTPAVRPDPSVAFLPGVGWDRKESGVYVVSECIGASSWYPCNDHPRDKATYSFRVTVEKPYTAAANGLLKEVIEEGDERTFVFDAPDPMASYLATLNVAEFGVIEATGPRGLPIRTYHPVGASAEELADFRRQAEVLTFLETVFGPYPFESAGAVIAYENIGGALECQTLPVYGRGCDLDVIVHELAHQWFGNCVSPDLWRDMWLNEGFASYATWLWEEHADGREAYERSARRAYARLRHGQTGSPYDPGVKQVFSGRVYVRGAFVLHGLRAEVGDETFFRILKGWVESRFDGNGSTHEFVQHASRTAGRDLAAFFDAWLFSPVTPEIPAWEPIEPPPERRRPTRDPPAAGGG